MRTYRSRIFFGKASANRLRESLLAAPTPEGTLNVMEDWLLAGWRQRACHPAVAFALSRFHASPLISIRTVTDAISLSPKRFIERFEAEVGLTPKRYSRLFRFQRAVAKAHSSVPLDWAQLARRVEEARCSGDFPWLYPPFPASCPFRSIMAHRGLLPGGRGGRPSPAPTERSVRIFRTTLFRS
jgi:AraC-like DNA-binding protein